MRIWSVAPKYLDTKGLVALWRETLLAKHVLLGQTKGYTNHPQLKRFRDSGNAIDAIDKYLEYISLEADGRKYSFDKTKFEIVKLDIVIPVTQGQVEYEMIHLKRKLQRRDPEKFNEIKDIKDNVEIVPIFKIIPGKVEDWESVKSFT